MKLKTEDEIKKHISTVQDMNSKGIINSENADAIVYALKWVLGEQ